MILLLNGLYRINRYEAPSASAIDELDVAIDLGEEGVVATATDVDAGLEAGAALADDDGAAGNELTAKGLDAEPLGVGIATVFRAT